MNDTLLLAIIDKFNAGSIGELDLNDGSTRLILKRGGAAVSAGSPAGAASGAGEDSAGVGLRLGLPVQGQTPDGQAPGMGGELIESPIVAAFYASASPEAPPFVEPGSRVKAGETLCILEAMKMMNHLEAEFDCEILRVLAVNGDLVEYGQALFEVKRL